MNNEKISRRLFLAKTLPPNPSGIEDSPLTSNADQLFDKYSRKSLSRGLEGSNQNGESARRAPITSGLKLYTGPWRAWEASHLLRRLSYGVQKTDVDMVLKMSPADAVTKLLSFSAPTLPSPEPLNFYAQTLPDTGGVAFGKSWTKNNLSGKNAKDGNVNNYRLMSQIAWSWGLCLDKTTNLREKMTNFWYHFIPVKFNDLNSSVPNGAVLINDYMHLLRSNAAGNFKTLIKSISKSPAMLVYLGNQLSIAAAPNENFARELMELFVLGKVPDQKYTEADVKAAAKVFSGWRALNFAGKYPTMSSFNSAYHNQDDKAFSEFFGNTIIKNQLNAKGADEFDAFFEMLFKYQGITAAKYICRRLYRFFIYYDIDINTEKNIIEPLAASLIAHQWEIKPILLQLFSSEHFFDMANRGVMIKSPVDFIAGTFKTLNINTTLSVSGGYLAKQYRIWNYMQDYAYSQLDQGLGQVPNVSGWKAYYQHPVYYQNWINSFTIQRRSAFLSSLINGLTVNSTDIKLALEPVSFTKQFPVEIAADPDQLINTLIMYLLPVDLNDGYKQLLKENLLDGQQNTYWTSAWNNYIMNPNDKETYGIVKTRLTSLFSAMLQLAEFQLM